MRINRLILTIVLSLISTFSYAEISHEEWIKTIQLRMDLVNPSGDKGICLLYPITELPYTSKDYSYPALMLAKEYGLVDEILFISRYYGQNIVNYKYQLTEQGTSYFTTWPDVTQFGFCYGKLIVESIEQVKDLTVTYRYRIEQSPEWAYGLIQSYFDLPLNEPQKATAEFGYNQANELISLSSNYNYYLSVQ